MVKLKNGANNGYITDQSYNEEGAVLTNHQPFSDYDPGKND